MAFVALLAAFSLLQLVAPGDAVADVPSDAFPVPVVSAAVVVPVVFAPFVFAPVVFYRIGRVPIHCRRNNPFPPSLPVYRVAVVPIPDGVATTFEEPIRGGLLPLPRTCAFLFLRSGLDGSSDPCQLPGREPRRNGAMRKRPCTPSASCRR